MIQSKERGIFSDQRIVNGPYQYTVLGNSVKEDIILLERGEKNSFTYHIDPCGLSGEIRNNALYLYEPGADPESEAAFVCDSVQRERHLL